MTKKLKIELELEVSDYWDEKDAHCDGYPHSVVDYVHNLLFKNGESQVLMSMIRNISTSEKVDSVVKSAYKERCQEDLSVYKSAKIVACVWEHDKKTNLLKPKR